MAIGLLGSNSQQLTQATSLVATGTTSDVFTFPNPPTGLTWTGTLSVAPAQVTASTPTAALFTATIGATNWGEWGGNSVFGPVQVQANQQLKVNCSGLVAGVSYLCTLVGSSDQSNMVQPIYPAANSTALVAQIAGLAPSQVFNNSYASSVSGTDSIPALPAGTRTLIFELNTAAAVVSFNVTGITTGAAYYSQPPYLAGNVVVVPISGVETGVNLSWALLPARTLTITAWADTGLYPESEFYNGPGLAASTAAVGLTTLVSGPARILTASVEGGAGGAALLVWKGTTIMRADAVAASSPQTAEMTFPPNTILQSGQLLQGSISVSGFVGVTYAYP